MKTVNIQLSGYSISADWHKGTNREVLLVLTGFNSSKAKYADFIKNITDKTNQSALVIDYSGHGDSPFDLGEISPAQHFLEVVAAYDWLKTNHSELTINVMGTSYGGYHGTRLTLYRKINMLVLRVPAIYPPEIFYSKWKDIRAYENSRQYRKSRELVAKNPLLKSAARKFSGPALVVTHELDDICPKSSTNEFTKVLNADAWDAPGYLHSVKASNVSKEQQRSYESKIANWLRGQGIR